jgi:hypothetical protein
MATTTPNYGWDVPTSTDYVKDGAVAIETLGDDIDATLGVALNSKLHAGLVLIKTQAIGSGVASVTVTDAFSTTYDNYKIILSNVKLASAAAVMYRNGTSNVNYYYTQTNTGGTYATASGNLLFQNGNNVAQFETGLIAANSTTTTSGGSIELQNPFLATSTSIQSMTSDSRPGGSGVRQGSGFHEPATSYTSFTFLVSGTTFTSGNIAVYGYAKD